MEYFILFIKFRNYFVAYFLYIYFCINSFLFFIFYFLFFFGGGVIFFFEAPPIYSRDWTVPFYCFIAAGVVKKWRKGNHDNVILKKSFFFWHNIIGKRIKLLSMYTYLHLVMKWKLWKTKVKLFLYIYIYKTPFEIEWIKPVSITKQILQIL